MSSHKPFDLKSTSTDQGLGNSAGHSKDWEMVSSPNCWWDKGKTQASVKKAVILGKLKYSLLHSFLYKTNILRTYFVPGTVWGAAAEQWLKETKSLPSGISHSCGDSKQWTVTQVNVKFQENAMKKNKADDGERGGDGRGAAALNADGQWRSPWGGAFEQNRKMRQRKQSPKVLRGRVLGVFN